MTTLQTSTVIILVIYAILIAYAITKIWRIEEFNTSQKVLNSMKIIFMPIIWPILLFYIIRKPSPQTDEEK